MSKLLVALLLTFTLVGCSDNQEESDRKARREREMEQIARDSARQENADNQNNQQVEDDRAAEPPAPREPEYREVTTYYFTSLTEKNLVGPCDYEGEETGCGMKFTGCADADYYCQTAVKAISKTKKELVTD